MEKVWGTTVESIAREKFKLAFEVAKNASMDMDEAPAINPERFSISLEGEELRFTDHPISRSMFAAKDHFKGDSKTFLAFMPRFWALAELIRNRKLDAWLQDEIIHPAVIYAASETKINKNGKFPLQLFLNRAQEIATNEKLTFDS